MVASNLKGKTAVFTGSGRAIGAAIALRLAEDGANLSSIPLTDQALTEADAVVIVTDHSNIDYQFLVDHCPLVVDTRNAMTGVTADTAKIWKA